jgi:hypothetical protein
MELWVRAQDKWRPASERSWLNFGGVIGAALGAVDQQAVNLVFLGVQQGCAALSADVIDRMVAGVDDGRCVQNVPGAGRDNDFETDLSRGHAAFDHSDPEADMKGTRPRDGANAATLGQGSLGSEAVGQQRVVVFNATGRIDTDRCRAPWLRRRNFPWSRAAWAASAASFQRSRATKPCRPDSWCDPPDLGLAGRTCGIRRSCPWRNNTDGPRAFRAIAPRLAPPREAAQRALTQARSDRLALVPLRNLGPLLGEQIAGRARCKSRERRLSQRTHRAGGTLRPSGDKMKESRYADPRKRPQLKVSRVAYISSSVGHKMKEASNYSGL